MWSKGSLAQTVWFKLQVSDSDPSLIKVNSSDVPMDWLLYIRVMNWVWSRNWEWEFDQKFVCGAVNFIRELGVLRKILGSFLPFACLKSTIFTSEQRTEISNTGKFCQVTLCPFILHWLSYLIKIYVDLRLDFHVWHFSGECSSKLCF